MREGAELLRDNVGGALSPEQREIVRIVRENTLSLQKLIEDLLTYHQTRAMEPQTVGPVLLADVVRRVLKEHKLAALARMVTFDAKLRPALIVGDADKIRTIVDNLVSNAIKYSPRSASIVVALGIERDFAVLDVIDHGPGIDAEERERIFDSFYQGKPPVDGRVKGSGLGLAIAREYALAHGGRIEVLDRARPRAWRPLPPVAAARRRGRRRPERRRRRPAGADHDRGRRMSLRAVVALVARRRGLLAGCATPPVAAAASGAEPRAGGRHPAPAPMIEYPPIEPVEPPVGAGAGVPRRRHPREPASRRRAPPPVADARPAPEPRPSPRRRSRREEQQLAGLLSDLQRYGS